jgi:hypothetical protein
MRANHPRFAFVGLCLAGAIGLVVACSSSPSGPGQLAVNLVDFPSDQLDHIWVNVTKVTAHSAVDGWVTVSNDAKTVDLLALQATPELFGTVKLSSGQITQIRLYVAQDGNWVHLISDTANPPTQTPLKVPSGYQSGIKIIGPWDITACNKTSVTLDFNAQQSIEVHSTGGTDEWILRPTIHVKKTESSPVACGDVGPGGACDESNPCSEGNFCNSGTCTPTTQGGGAGSSCNVADDCVTKICTTGTCQKSPPNGTCAANTDCTNDNCWSDGSCAPCSSNLECQAIQADSMCDSSGSCIQQSL